jgi:hypothetical protein
VVLLQTLALLALAPLSAARADEPIKGEVKAVNDGGFLRLMFDKQKKPPVVRVKVAMQPTFVRYVFTMPGTVNVIPERADGRLTLNFDQQVAWDLADAKAFAPSRLIPRSGASIAMRHSMPVSPN